MKLQELLSRYPFQIATPNDNERILEFFENSSMDLTQFTLRYSRTPDFFSFLRLQAERSIVVVYQDESKIKGVGTIGFNTTYLRSEPTLTGYLSDLRMCASTPRKVRLQWRRFYSELMEHAPEIEEFFGCRYFYSAILDENIPAIRALTNPNSEIYYRRMYSYSSFHIIARLPLVHRFRNFLRMSNLVFRAAGSSDVQNLKSFLHWQNIEKPFGHYFRLETPVPVRDEWARRMGLWEGMDFQSFLIAEQQGEILGCVAPWTSISTRRLILDQPSKRLTLPFLAFGTLLRLLGRPELVPGKPIKTLYLTHLELKSSLDQSQKKAILNGFLHTIFDRELEKQCHIVSLLLPAPSPGSASLVPLPNFFLKKTVNGTLFQVVSKKNTSDWIDLEKTRHPPAFEIALA